MDLDKLGRITGGIGLLLASMLAAPFALAQQVEEGPQVAPQDTILSRISLLEARIDSLASELGSLKVAVAEAGIAPLPGQDELEAAPQDELEALRAAARRAVEEGGPPAEEPGEAAKSRTSSLQLLNPEISVTGDFVGAATAPGEGNGSVSAIPREFEFSFQAVIDPFARTKIFFTREEELPIAGLTPEEEEPEGGGQFEIEEGYVDWVALPAGMSVKLGLFRQELGLYNRWHTHALLEVDRPLATVEFVGEEGLIQAGASLALPIFQTGPATHSAWFEITSGTNEVLFADGNDPSYLGRVQSFFDLGPSSYIQIGADGVWGRNDEEDLTSRLYSVDVSYRWTPPGAALYRDLILKGEWYWAHQGFGGEDLDGTGGYAQALYKFTRRWEAGVRADYVKRFDPRPKVFQLVPSVTWWQSEWLRFRLQGNIVKNEGAPTDFTLLFQTMWSVGPHRHEAY